MESLTHAFPAARNQRQRDRATQHCTVIRRGHMSDRTGRWLLSLRLHHLRSLVEDDIRVRREQPNQLLAVGRGHGWPLQRTLADKVWFGLADSPTQAGVVRRH